MASSFIDVREAQTQDPRALRILAKTIYRELRTSGLREEDVMTIASELLSLVAGDVKDRRTSAQPTPSDARTPAKPDR